MDTASSACTEGFAADSGFDFFELADDAAAANRGEFTSGCSDNKECCAEDCKNSETCVAFEFSNGWRKSCELPVKNKINLLTHNVLEDTNGVLHQCPLGNVAMLPSLYTDVFANSILMVFIGISKAYYCNRSGGTCQWP